MQHGHLILCSTNPMPRFNVTQYKHCMCLMCQCLSDAITWYHSCTANTVTYFQPKAHYWFLLFFTYHASYSVVFFYAFLFYDIQLHTVKAVYLLLNGSENLWAKET